MSTDAVSPGKIDSNKIITLFRRRLLGAGMWAFLGLILTSVSALLVNALMARILSPAELGNYFLIFSLIGMCLPLATAGLGQETVRRVAQAVSLNDLGLARTVVIRTTMISVGTSLLVALLLMTGVGQWFAVHILDSPTMAEQVGIIALLMILTVFQNLFVEILRGLRDIRLASIQGQLTRNVLIIATLGLLWFNGVRPTLTAVLLVTSGAVVLTDLNAVWSIIRKLSAPFVGQFGHNQDGYSQDGHSEDSQGESQQATNRQNEADIHTSEEENKQRQKSSPESVTPRALLLAAFPLMISKLAFDIAAYSNLWILGYFRTPEEVALYGTAARLVLLVAMPLSIVNFVIPPLVAEMHTQQRTDHMQRVVRIATTVAALPSLAMLLCFIFLGEPIVSIVYGDFYRPAAIILVIRSIGAISSVWTGPCGYALVMTGHARVSMNINLLSGLLRLILAFIGTYLYGAVGLAIAVALHNVTQNLLLLAYAKKYAGIWTHFAPSVLLLPIRWLREREQMPAA